MLELLLLRLHDEARRVVFDRERDRKLRQQRLGVIEHVPVHRVGFRVMTDQGEPIEAHDLTQPAREIVEQCLEIPMSDDSLCNGEERLVLLAGSSRRV